MADVMEISPSFSVDDQDNREAWTAIYLQSATFGVTDMLTTQFKWSVHFDLFGECTTSAIRA